MKKYRLLAVASMTLGMFVATHPASAQNAGAANVAARSQPAQAPSAGPKVGLIDMAHIFKNYDKFKDQTATLQKAAETAESEAQAMVAQGMDLQKQLKELAANSPDYAKIESQIIELKSKLDTFRQMEQREIARKQAEVYKAIYMDVQKAVALYTNQYHYSLILRFERAELSAATNPNDILKGMNRLVVHYQPQDDITETILGYLNDQYGKAQAAN